MAHSLICCANKFILIQRGTKLINAHLVRVCEFELPAVPGPGDELLAGLVCEELQQELPQLDGAGALVARQQGGGDHGLPSHRLENAEYINEC